MRFGILFIVTLLLATAVSAESGRPLVSPDGKQIEFNSDRSGTPHVYLINPDGSGERRLTEGTDDEGRAEWSADGTHLWLFRFAKDVTSIRTVSRDGKDNREVGRLPGRAGNVSPDDKHVIHSTGTWTAMRLMVSEPDGSNTKQVNDGTSIAWGTQWSPDGRQLAFGGHDADGVLAVFVMNADGSNRRQLTHLTAEEGSAQMPAWSHDGRRIAFQANHGKAADLWIIDVDGAKAHKISSSGNTGHDETPWWFPDGKQVAFQSDRSGQMQIWIMNADGSEPLQITK
jgi:TolB protein